MSEDAIKLSFKCPKCGGTVLELPDSYTDESHAKCKQCGADFGPIGEIKKKAVGMAKKDMEKKLRDTFKGSKGWKLK